MDISKREWWVRSAGGEEGPIPEETFQDRLRAGDIPLQSEIKSNYMDDWKPLLEIVSSDETFHRRSTPPPPVPVEDE